MVVDPKALLAETYETDETAWLERMAELIRQQRFDQLDYAHLQEYLDDMAGRDRREVKSRLRVLLAHLLNWEHQPAQRSGSWETTIRNQRDELSDILASGTLRNHAIAILQTCYQRAVLDARSETGLSAETFPSDCPYTLEHILRADLAL